MSVTAILEIARTDVPKSLTQRMKLADLLADSTMLPDHYRGQVSNILAAQFAAAALDVPLWIAFHELYVGTRGRVGMSALLMRALIVRAGHAFHVLASSCTSATVQIHRRGEASPRPPVTYRMTDAVLAGLSAENPLYTSDPRAMMMARATSTAARLYAADVVLGFGYTRFDLEDARGEAIIDVPDLIPQGTPETYSPVAAVPSPTEAEAPAAAEGPAFPACVGDLVSEVATLTPGGTKKSRKVATDRAQALWAHARASKWSNLPCQSDGKFVGALILERLDWLKKAPADAPVSYAPAVRPCPLTMFHGAPPAPPAPIKPRPVGELAAVPPVPPAPVDPPAQVDPPTEAELATAAGLPEGTVPLDGMPVPPAPVDPPAPVVEAPPVKAPRRRRSTAATNTPAELTAASA